MGISLNKARALSHTPLTMQGGMARPPEPKIDLRAFFIICFNWRGIR